MKPETIKERLWLTYLVWWRDTYENGKDYGHPPTEDLFWAWYAINKMTTDSQTSRVTVV